METRKQIARSLVENDPLLLTRENLDTLIEKIEEAYDAHLQLDYIERMETLRALSDDDWVRL